MSRQHARSGDAAPPPDRPSTTEVGRARAARPSLAALDVTATRCRALGDRTRLALVAALAATDELCVSDLAAVVEVSESAVSHSLRTLRQLRIVRYRKAGKVAYYALDPVWQASALGTAVLADLDAPERAGSRRPGRPAGVPDAPP